MKAEAIALVVVDDDEVVCIDSDRHNHDHGDDARAVRVRRVSGVGERGAALIRDEAGREQHRFIPKIS